MKSLDQTTNLTEGSGHQLAALQPLSDSIQTRPLPQITTQAPGYYRIKLGQCEITALYDGFVMLAPTLFQGISDQQLNTLLAAMFIDTDNGIQTSVNDYLINTGEHLILVDSGAGGNLGPTTGRLMDNLIAAGYRPEQIDTIILTHLHGDHIGGLVNDTGERVFVNAMIYTAKNEADYWLDENNITEVLQPKIDLVKRSVAPYAAAGRFTTLNNHQELLPGLTMIPAPGHTPGHSAYMLHAEGQHLLFWGDVVHNFAIQFKHPEVAIEFDSDQQQAIQTRKQLFAEAAKNKLWIAGTHIPFPGLGHVLAESDGYRWVPITYAPLN